MDFSPSINLSCRQIHWRRCTSIHRGLATLSWKGSRIAGWPPSRNSSLCWALNAQRQYPASAKRRTPSFCLFSQGWSRGRRPVSIGATRSRRRPKRPKQAMHKQLRQRGWKPSQTEAGWAQIGEFAANRYARRSSGIKPSRATGRRSCSPARSSFLRRLPETSVAPCRR